MNRRKAAVFFQHSSSRKRMHLPRALSGNGGNVLLLLRGGKRVSSSFKQKKIKINCWKDRGRFFPILGSCKRLTARCECPPGSWMRPKGFNTFPSAAERLPAPHQGSSMERQHLFQVFQTIFQHPPTQCPLHRYPRKPASSHKEPLFWLLLATGGNHQSKTHI